MVGLPRKRLSLSVEYPIIVKLHILGQRLTLPLQQAVSCLSALELAVHLAQDLPRGEYGLAAGS
jgi:hypothetical protein